MYPDLSTHHDWPVKKDLCFVCHKTGNSVESAGGPEQGSLHCFADGTNQSLVIVCTQAKQFLQRLR